MDEIQFFESLHRQCRIGQYVDPATAHLFERFGSVTGVKQVQFQTERIGDLSEQVRIGPDQTLGVLRIAPEKGGVVRCASRHQTVALPRCRCREWRCQHQRDYGQFQRKSETHEDPLIARVNRC